MAKRIKILVPDAGPLFTLAAANALNILKDLGLPVVLADVVATEVLGHPQSPEARKIAAFHQANPGIIIEEPTSIGELVKQAAKAGHTVPRSMGEQAVISMLLALRDSDPDEPILLVFEDGFFAENTLIVPGKVHAMSTRAFLNELEKNGFIPSAQKIWDDAIAAGRTPAAPDFDKPSKIGDEFPKT